MIVTKHNRPAWEDLLPVIHTGKLASSTKLIWLYLVATGGIERKTKRSLYEGIGAKTNVGWETAKKAMGRLAELRLADWHVGATRIRAWAIVRKDGD